MNKRLPLLLSLLAMILLAASLAYWILQLYQPPQRPIAAVPQAAMPEPSAEAAATLFGGQPAVASATNYQLTGIVSAGRNSVAILVADNAPPKALGIGKELSPGITLAEVHPRYVMLSDNGMMKRVDLAPDTKPAAPMGGPADAPPGVQAMGAVPATPQTPAGTEAGPSLGAVPAGAVPASVDNPGENPPPEPQEPPMAPGAVSQQLPANQQQVPNNPPPNQVQMPPPTRSSGTPTGQAPPVQ